jgi:ABC-type transport system involved in multi-copper enzyme maturation permease subunit
VVTLFSVLVTEAFRDAMRRRIVPVIVVMSLLSLMAVDSVTSCSGTTQIVAQGEQVPGNDFGVSGFAGTVIFTLLSMWMILLAGLLASDHLAETISDGSANLVLARPVRRAEFASARLMGALGIAYVTGAVVLTTSAYLLHFRHGVSLGPVVWAGLAAVVGAQVVGAVAMALSLVLTRVATVLGVLAFMGVIAFVNSLTLFGVELEGAARVLQHLTPPLATAVVLALGPWLAPNAPDVDLIVVCLKLAVWAVASMALLLAVFRRVEIRS